MDSNLDTFILFYGVGAFIGLAWHLISENLWRLPWRRRAHARLVAKRNALLLGEYPTQKGTWDKGGA